MLNKPVYITARTRSSDTAINNNVFYAHLKYNYMVERLKHLPVWGMYALLAYMPFHVFLAQSLSLLTGGLETWKIAKDLLAISLLVIVGIVVLANERLQKKHFIILGLTIACALLHIGIYLINKETELDVALLASTYNNRLLWYLIIGMGSAVLIGKKFTLHLNTVIKIIIITSTLVCLFGLVQWFLPGDFLTHFGYSVDRGVKPNFLINEDPDFPRIMSTIRDPNSLGAFLIVPLLILAQLLISKQSRRKLLIGGLLLLHGLVLLLTFSRAAWGGMIISLALLFLISHNRKVLKYARRFWPLLILAIILISMAGYGLRNVPFVRSVVFRIDDTNPASHLDSDELHLHFIKEGAEGVEERPLGHGPGTAGIVSIQNESGSFLTENYYVQIAHEIGVLGLLIFLAAWGYVLWLMRKSLSLVPRALLASAGAYAAMAMVMHLWSNEAVAAQWWLISGFILGSVTSAKNVKKL